MSDKTRTVLYTNEAGVARITLNRPERRNALNDQLIRALQNAIVTAASAEYTSVAVTRRLAGLIPAPGGGKAAASALC